MNENSNISIDEENEQNEIDVKEEVENEHNDKAGAIVEDDDGVSNTMDNTTQEFKLRRSLRNAKNARYNYRNRFERELQYMLKSVKNICSAAKIQKQTKLNMKDKYRQLVEIMMNLMSKDDQFAQVNYKQGVKRHGDKTVEVMVKE